MCYNSIMEYTFSFPKRIKLIKKAVKLHKRGLHIVEIAKMLGLHRNTIRKYINWGKCNLTP